MLGMHRLHSTSPKSVTLEPAVADDQATLGLVGAFVIAPVGLPNVSVDVPSHSPCGVIGGGLGLRCRINGAGAPPLCVLLACTASHPGQGRMEQAISSRGS